ncbi:ArsR/SmtB family transcription factor [Streptomyces sp. NPDC020490]|uniref:ArsR/SmtB family transcription factor n=1 Tax=Streptomyces sp. NPDC020490 TaxID=3365078 RepID=UPI003789885F
MVLIEHWQAESGQEHGVAQRTTTGHRAAPEHTHPDDVSVQTALAALADPVRLTLVRELAESAEWSRSCGSFDVPVGKAALSHHFAVLRGAGLVEQRDEGPRRVNRLRRREFDARFPGLLELVLRPDAPPREA